MNTLLQHDGPHRAGYRPIGTLSNRLRMSLWWHEHDRTELIVIEVGRAALVKGSKCYHMLSIDDGSRTWMRDIGALHDWLQGHFADLQLSFSWFRDVPEFLASTHIERTGRAGTQADKIAELQAHLEQTRSTERAARRLAGETGSIDPMLHAYLRARASEHADQAASTAATIQNAREADKCHRSLIASYLRHGSAARLSFSVSSHIHLARSEAALNDAIEQIRKELRDLDRYQVRQKLGGGKLRIQVRPADQPEVSWMEQWFGGSLDPRQLDDLDAQVRDEISDAMGVYPTEEVRVEGELVEHAAKIAPRVVRSMCGKLDHADDRRSIDREDDADLEAMMLITPGLDPKSGEPVTLDLNRMDHTLLSGSTGSGKSWAARALVEPSLAHGDLSLLVLDPRNQWIGLTSLSNDIGYFAPSLGGSLELPKAQALLASQRSVVCLKWVSEPERCRIAGEVMQSVFDQLARSQSETARMVILIEEAHLFTRQSVRTDEAKTFERILSMIFREGRKYGIRVLLVTQSIRDLTHQLATVRQNASTKIFMRNTDREIEVAREVLSNPRDITALNRGEAIITSLDDGPKHIRFAPPHSRVWDLGREETLNIVGGSAKHTPSREELGLLMVLGDQSGEPFRSVSALGRAAGIGSRRRLLNLLEKLEHNGWVRSRRLRVRGHPRGVELTESGARTLSEHAQQKCGQEGDPT